MKWSRIVLIVLGVGLAVAAAILFIANRQRSAAAAAWPSVEGRIAASAVEVQERGGRRNRDRDRYLPRLRYDYSVGGRSFSNDRIWLTETKSWKSRGGAEEAIAAFPPGAAVPVYYDPANPSDSALIVRGVVWPFVIMFLAGMLLIGLGFFLNIGRRRAAARA